MVPEPLLQAVSLSSAETLRRTSGLHVTPVGVKGPTAPPALVFPGAGPFTASPREQGYVYLSHDALSIVYAKHFFVTWAPAGWGVGFLCWSEGPRLISWGIVSVHEGLNGLRAQIPADCRWGKLSLSLHLLTPGRQLEARLGVVLRPGIEFACDWSDSLRLRLTGAPPQTTVLGRVISTPWAERQPGWMFESPFQVLALLEEPAVTPLASEPDCAAGSLRPRPSWGGPMGRARWYGRCRALRD